MGAIAAILCAVGIIVVIYGLMQKMKAGRLVAAPFAKTGDAASKGDSLKGPKDALSVEGDLKCAQPLSSPVTGTACIYYELKVEGSWKEGDSTKSKTYEEEKKAAEFSLDDGSGPIKIVAGKGGDFEPFEKTYEETKKEGFFADLKNAVGNKEPIMFGKYAFDNPPMSKADKFTCTEKVVKVQPRMFALGKFENGTITSPSWRSLVLSNKGRDALIGATLKTSKNCLIGGAVGLLVGIILGVISSVMAPSTTADVDVKPATEQTAAQPENTQR